MGAGKFEEALELFQKSRRLGIHFKTLELIGECFMRLGRWDEAVVPLAAASTLNKGARAPSLLAETCLKTGRLHEAVDAADLAFARQPHNRRLLALKEEADRALRADVGE